MPKQQMDSSIRNLLNLHKPLPVILVGDALNLVSWQVVSLTNRIKKPAESAPEMNVGLAWMYLNLPQKCKLINLSICST